MTTQTQLTLQKNYILATGSSANVSELAAYDGMVSQSGGFGTIKALVDDYMGNIASQQGIVATVQSVARNGFGLTLSVAQTNQVITDLTAQGINSWSKLFDYCIALQNTYGTTLDNRAQAASGFLDALNLAGKSTYFTGAGVSSAVNTLLQNIGSSATSLANGTSGFNALATNLTGGGISGTVVDGYVTGAVVFADTNGDGVLNAGEWRTTTDANGTFVVPNNVTASKIIAYGGIDLLTGNPFQGVLSSSAGSTMINPITTLIEAMVTGGQSSTVADATAAVQTALGLPQNINLLSYNPLAVLASSSATAAEKAVALSVQASAQQVANIITQAASVIDNATASATLQSAAAAVSNAIASAIATAGGALNLSSMDTIGGIVQAAVTATGSITTTPAQVAQIAQITSASNTAAAAATTITTLAQAADVAQGSATTSLIAGALGGNFTSAVSGFTGTALITANYAATVGSIAPGVIAPPTAAAATAAAVAAAAAAAAAVADAAALTTAATTAAAAAAAAAAATAAAEAAAAAAAAAATTAAAVAAAAAAAAAAAPTAILTYSKDAGATTAITASAKDADTMRIIATFSKAVSDGTPTITIDNSILAATAMTKIDSTHYYYDLNVPAGDIATAAVMIGGAHDATSNTIAAVPTNAIFAVDNTAPTAPTGVTLTPVGGTVVANTLNTTNTNMTASATITAGQATGGSAVLKIAGTTLATDATILVGDTSVTFTLGAASTAALQAAVAAGGTATVTVIDAAGNATVSTASNPTLVVDYTAPTAPHGVALTPIGGTVVANTLNNTNTNLTAVATITAGQATGGSAVLKVGGTTIATDATILAGDSSVTFDLSPADNAALQLAVATGGVATVTVLDAAGNASVSTLSNPTLAVDYAMAFTTLTTANDSVTGGAGNDTFTGTYGNGAGPYTFNVGDILNGSGGTADTLNITTGAEASTPPDGLWANKSNFEKVVFNSIGNGAQVVTTGANFDAAFATNGVDLTVQTLLGAIDVTMTGFLGVAAITTTTIGAGAHTITTGTGIATVNATALAAGAQTINGVGLTTVNATINDAGDQVIGTTNGGNLVTVNATILAAGAQTITSTSGSNVTVNASAAAGTQTIVTGAGNDTVTATGAAGQTNTITTNAGNDTIVAGLGTDLITGGLGADVMTGGGGTDTFAFGTNGSVIGTSMDIITDFNKAGADILTFGASTVLPGVDATALVAGSGAGSNVQTSAGGLITFAAADNTLALKIAAVQADTQLDAVNTVAMFVDSGNTYVYYAGALTGNADDQLIQLTGITTLMTITGGATTTIAP